MMRRPALTSLALALTAGLVSACAGSDRAPDEGMDGPTLDWGPRLEGSVLSPLAGAQDGFSAAATAAVARAARAVPIGASQTPLPAGGEMSVSVEYGDDGELVYDFTDRGRIVVRVPIPVPRQGLEFAAFTDLIPGIQPDLSTYPHELLGVWAGLDEAGAFWTMSPGIPPVEFGPGSPVSTATYEGDAVGLHALDGNVTKFAADVELVADFDAFTLGGAADGFRTFEGSPLGDLAITLDETTFDRDGAPFSGNTSSAGTAGAGTWGGRWSDGGGWTMGGTFGFAADDESLAVLGAFTACSCASIAR